MMNHLYKIETNIGEVSEKIVETSSPLLSSETPEDVNKIEKKKIKSLPIILFLLLLIIGCLIYIFLMMRADDPTVIEGPTGEIYLTLSPLGTGRPNIYKLDLESMELEEFFPDSPYGNYMAKFSPDGDKMVFVKVDWGVDWGVDKEPVVKVVLFDDKSKTILGETESLNHFPRNPVFSLDGDSLAYWTFESDEGLDFARNPENNSIYIVSTDSFEREKVTNGAFPIFFSANNSIIYLKSDGLYMMDLSTKVEKQILDFPTDYPPEEFLTEKQKESNLPSWLFLRFEYCSTNNHLIITNTVSNTVFVYKFNNVLEEFEEEFIFEKGFHAPNWPVSSPDGKFLVVQEFEPDESYLPKVSLFSKFDWTKVESFNIYDYDPNFIWISDWVVK